MSKSRCYRHKYRTWKRQGQLALPWGALAVTTHLLTRHQLGAAARLAAEPWGCGCTQAVFHHLTHGDFEGGEDLCPEARSLESGRGVPARGSRRPAAQSSSGLLALKTQERKQKACLLGARGVQRGLTQNQKLRVGPKIESRSSSKSLAIFLRASG